MRVVVASDRFDGVSSRQVSVELARAWAALGAAVAVVPMGRAGAGLDQALADLLEVEPGLVNLGDQPVALIRGELAGRPVAVVSLPRPVADLGRCAEPIDQQASSQLVGQAIAAAVAVLPSPARRADPAHPGEGPLIVVELDATGFHDGGAGMLAALGATAQGVLGQGVARLTGIADLDLAPARELLAGTELVLAVPAEQQTWQLTGLRGITSVRGHASGSLDPAVLLQLDQNLLDLAAAAQSAPGAATAPGSGAGGVGWAFQLLGGRVTTGSQLCADLADLPTSVAASDLVVAGTQQLDFGTMGGEVISHLSALAQAKLRPVIAIAGMNHISARELRSVGIEAAYSIGGEDCTEPGLLSAEQIGAAAGPIARSWSW